MSVEARANSSGNAAGRDDAVVLARNLQGAVMPQIGRR
jgi:hypothetical protein